MSCKTCPWAFTDESEQVQNYGCLPTPWQTIEMLRQHGAVWGCHCTSEKEGNLKMCSGLVEHLKNPIVRELDPTLPTIQGNEPIIDYDQFEDPSSNTYYERYKV